MAMIIVSNEYLEDFPGVRRAIEDYYDSVGMISNNIPTNNTLFSVAKKGLPTDLTPVIGYVEHVPNELHGDALSYCMWSESKTYNPAQEKRMLAQHKKAIEDYFAKVERTNE